MLKLNYFLADIFILSAEKQPIKLSWRKIEWLLLLVFYDPECPSCHDVMMEMLHDKLLQQEVDAGNLTVLAIYTEGNLDVWKTTISELPKEWIVGTDREEIKQRCLYDLKAMPSLYLLDGDKKVILKDVSYRKICSEILY